MMKRLTRWFAIPAALAIALGTAGTVLSQSIAITPTTQPIQVSGTSGGSKNGGSCAGAIAASPNHIINVTEDTNLEFTLQAGGQPALLIRSASGQNFCVPADRYSNGTITVPGRWTKGTYSIFVGDRANGQSSYTLSITPN